MKSSTLQSVAGMVVALLVGALVAAAGSSGSVTFAGIPVFALCAALAFIVQWLAFIPAWLNRTELYYDLMGSITYITIVLVALALNDSIGPRDLLISAMIIIWALRLGSFLFVRVKKAGADRRFDRIKQDFAQFLMTWTIQGLWVTFTAAAGLASILSASAQPLGLWALIGSLLWVSGFAIEVVADRQKSAFKANPDNNGQFIQSGLWAWSRHPNYFGEMMLWFGIAIIALPHLSGWQYATLASPVFVFVLIYFVSGVRMLEARAEKRWGNDPEYQVYRDRTPVLVPMPPGRQSR